MSKYEEFWKEAAIEAGKVTAFLASARRRHEFSISCPVEIRISYIYRVIFPGLALFRFYARFLVARAAQLCDFAPLKRWLYRLIGVNVGKGAFISPDAFIDPHFPSLITIGDHAIIGWGARLFTHEFDGVKYTMGRIDIGKGAVIGAFTVVKGGVSVGEGAMVHAAGIVLRDVPAGARYGPVATLREIMSVSNE